MSLLKTSVLDSDVDFCIFVLLYGSIRYFVELVENYSWAAVQLISLKIVSVNRHIEDELSKD